VIGREICVRRVAGKEGGADGMAPQAGREEGGQGEPWVPPTVEEVWNRRRSLQVPGWLGCGASRRLI